MTIFLHFGHHINTSIFVVRAYIPYFFINKYTLELAVVTVFTLIMVLFYFQLCYCFKDPAGEVRIMMEQIGFKDIDVKATYRTYIHKGGVEEFKSKLHFV